MSLFSMHWIKSGDSRVDRGSGVCTAVIEQFGLVRLHRPAAPSLDAAERTRGPGFGFRVRVGRHLLPRATPGSVYDFVSVIRSATGLHRSSLLSPNQSLQPTGLLARG